MKEESEGEHETNVEAPSTGWTNKSSAHVVETLSRSSLVNSVNKRRQNRPFVNDESMLSNDRDTAVNTTSEGSVSWPKNERGQFRGMVNHMRRKLQSMTKKSNDKEQFKVIHAHLVKYMGDNRGRQQLVLPIPVGDWGTVQQLLNCLKKKKL
uniref:Uncharacterized protein n=1 Tax=Ascaris lumbricoides TaxID=6252 RepID=A0A0M3ILC6_ASCLU